MSSSAVESFRARGLRPKKSFGQNFLADPRIAARIAELGTTPECGTVVEIGAGLGALTAPLLARAARVVAIERDRDLVPILEETFAADVAAGRLAIVEGDAVQLDWTALAAGGPAPHTLAGNLPYQITGRLLELAVRRSSDFARAVFMVQREVADRLVARAGDDAYGALSVFTQAAFAIERALVVSPGAFHPRPDVESAVVLLTPLDPPRARETDDFRACVKAAFEQRRKTLRNAWSKLGPREAIAARAEAAGIDLDARGETLSVEQFARFAATATR